MGCCDHKKPRSKPPTGPNDQCLNCALKHISCAKAIWKETKLGYAQSQWDVMGELSAAEHHLVKDYAHEAWKIRKYRLMYEQVRQYIVPFDELRARLLKIKGED